jgi:hypothetical protein
MFSEVPEYRQVVAGDASMDASIDKEVDLERQSGLPSKLSSSHRMEIIAAGVDASQIRSWREHVVLLD